MIEKFKEAIKDIHETVCFDLECDPEFKDDPKLSDREKKIYIYLLARLTTIKEICEDCCPKLKNI
tara:strand:- start:1641 stop:1835 length:195 start_codon:yes stop_codon:yes gene_type:complete